MLIRRRKNPPFTLWEFNCSSFEQTWIPFIQGCIVPSLVEISSVVLEKIFKFVNVFLYFIIISPGKKVGTFIWTNLTPLHPRMQYAKFGWNWLSGSGEDFLISSKYFRYFIIISPWKKVGPFIGINLSPHHPRMHCAKFRWNWPSGSGEDFKISLMYFCSFVIISPWKRVGPFI